MSRCKIDYAQRYISNSYSRFRSIDNSIPSLCAGTPWRRQCRRSTTRTKKRRKNRRRRPRRPKIEIPAQDSFPERKVRGTRLESGTESGTERTARSGTERTARGPYSREEASRGPKGGQGQDKRGTCEKEEVGEAGVAGQTSSTFQGAVQPLCTVDNIPCVRARATRATQFPVPMLAGLEPSDQESATTERGMGCLQAQSCPPKEGGGRLGGGGGEVCARGIFYAEAEQEEVQETQKCQSRQLISVACEATERPPSSTSELRLFGR